MTASILAPAKKLYEHSQQHELIDLVQAAYLGRKMPVPFSVDSGEVPVSKQLAGGSQSLLFASTYKGSPCAVKKAIIRTTNDLENFRKDLLMSLEVQHRNVLGLIAARLLPPRESRAH